MLKWSWHILIICVLFIMMGEVEPGAASSGTFTVYLPYITTAPPTYSDPLLIDGNQGSIFATATEAASAYTVKLAADNGRILATYPYSGKLALDRSNGRLVIDQGNSGLVILDVAGGHLLHTIFFPETDDTIPPPQIDSISGTVYAFRNQTVYEINPVTGLVVQMTTMHIPGSVCGTPTPDQAITRTFHDLVNRRLYLTFTTYVCTPWYSESIIAFQLPGLGEIGRYQTEQRYQAVPFLDSLYGTTSSRVGTQASWAWNGYTAWHEAPHDSDSANSLNGIVADWGRQLIYDAVDDTIWIYQADNHETIGSVQLSGFNDEVSLAGHDPITDQLYFLENGRLLIYKTDELLNLRGNTNKTSVTSSTIFLPKLHSPIPDRQAN